MTNAAAGFVTFSLACPADDEHDDLQWKAGAINGTRTAQWMTDRFPGYLRGNSRHSRWFGNVMQFRFDIVNADAPEWKSAVAPLWVPYCTGSGDAWQRATLVSLARSVTPVLETVAHDYAVLQRVATEYVLDAEFGAHDAL